MVSACEGEDLGDVHALCEHALGDGVLIAERGAGAYSSMHVLAGLVTIEEYERALAFTDELERAAHAQGSIANVLVATGVRGWISLFRGDLARGEEVLRPLVDTAAENGIVLLLVTVLWWLTDVIIERPANEALAAMVESIELPPTFAEVAGGAWLLTVRGQLRAGRGAAPRPKPICGRPPGCSRESASGRCTCHHVPCWRSYSGRTIATRPAHWWRRNWRSRTARALPGRGASRLRAAGLLADRDEGIEILREWVAVLAESPARYEHSCSLVELGAALRRAGRRAESRGATTGRDGDGAPLRRGTSGCASARGASSRPALGRARSPVTDSHSSPRASAASCGLQPRDDRMRRSRSCSTSRSRPWRRTCRARIECSDSRVPVRAAASRSW